MFEYLQEPPTKIMLLGCGCSTESEVTAQVSHLFNITQVGWDLVYNYMNIAVDNVSYMAYNQMFHVKIYWYSKIKNGFHNHW